MDALTKIIRIDLTDMEKSVARDDVNLLIKKGWTIRDSVPVTDEGKPFLLLILEKTNKRYEQAIILFIMILVIGNIYAVFN